MSDTKEIQINEDVGLSNNTVSCIYSFGQGSALVGTDNGINLIENNEVVEIWDSYSEIFNGEKITHLIGNDQFSFALTDKHEIVVFDLEKEVRINEKMTTNINILINSLAFGGTDVIRSLSYADHKIWVGMDQSLLAIEVTKNNTFTFQKYNIKDVESIEKGDGFYVGYDLHDSLFLFNSKRGVYFKKKHEMLSGIKFLIQQKMDSYWLGQNKSVSHLSINSEGIHLVKQYGIDEGFLGVQPFHNAAIVNETGGVLVGCVKGLLNISPKEYKGTPRDLNVILKGVLLNGDIKDWSPHCTKVVNNIPLGLKLLYNHVNLTFQVSSVHLKNPNEIDFKYKLLGWDEEFREKSGYSLKGDNGFFNIDYEHIESGEYQLLVYAKTPHGNWSSNPLKYNFEILPVWWKTTTFIVSSILVVVGLIIFIIMFRTERLLKEKEKLEVLVEERTKDLMIEKSKSESLLLNILPSEIALELKTFGSAKTKKYTKASVLFTDFKGFTQLSTQMSAIELVEKLDEIFVAFDEVIERNGLEKIKTIGDAYMCASGVPKENKFQVHNIVVAGLQLVEVMSQFNLKQEKLNQPIWDVRVGIHTGEIIAGVVGKKKFAYDVWGDTVNIASRMESNSEPGRVNVSSTTYREVKQFFNFEERGFIKAKNRGELEMYFVNSIQEEYRKNNNPNIPGQNMFEKE